MLARAHTFALRLYRVMPRWARRRAVRGIAPSFTVGAMCIVERDDGRILMVRHLYRADWGVPGGLLKRGEEADAGGRREAREEVGIDIELVGDPAVVVDPDPRRVDVVFPAKLAEGVNPDTIRPVSPEIVEAAWFRRDELPALQYETADALVALARVHPPTWADAGGGPLA